MYATVNATVAYWRFVSWPSRQDAPAKTGRGEAKGAVNYTLCGGIHSGRLCDSVKHCDS